MFAMPNPSMWPLWLPLLLAVLASALSAHADMATGLIPNRFSLGALLLALPLHLALSGWGGLLGATLAALGCGAVPYLLFTRGGMGGGDVKLFAALGALLGLGPGLLLQWLACALVAVYGLWALARRGGLARLCSHLAASLPAALRPRAPAPNLADAEHAPMQVRMGAAILAACLLVCADGLLGLQP